MSASDLPPMAGAYRVEANALRFEPQFPLEPGLRYRGVFRPDQLPGGNSAAALVESVYQSPRRTAMPATLVSRVYPSADTLPENLLKFYVHSTGPMSRGNIYDHIRLRDESGRDVELPFLEIDEELWDATTTRLTLIIDPGRIKRGVRPLEEMARRSKLAKATRSRSGASGVTGRGISSRTIFRKRSKLRPLTANRLTRRDGKSNLREPIRDPPGRFPRTDGSRSIPAPHPRDRRSGRGGARKVSLEDQERRWTFTPDNVWRRGRYQLIIHTTLEDLAGNNIGKPFEVDLFEGVERRLSTTTVKLSFEIQDQRGEK